VKSEKHQIIQEKGAGVESQTREIPKHKSGAMAFLLKRIFKTEKQEVLESISEYCFPRFLH
jgi:hypothetical protein